MWQNYIFFHRLKLCFYCLCIGRHGRHLGDVKLNQHSYVFTTTTILRPMRYRVDNIESRESLEMGK